MEQGISPWPAYANFFGESLRQSVPLACFGLVAQIALYTFVTWIVLSRKVAASRAEGL